MAVAAVVLLVKRSDIRPTAPIHKYGMVSISNVIATYCQYEVGCIAVAWGCSPVLLRRTPAHCPPSPRRPADAPPTTPPARRRSGTSPSRSRPWASAPR